ncbi:MAG: UvrD-helicase domain-containing protein [Lachnospiraceae bacterium]|nr:UvrD-helicase domain-containing protein [Lachnospiraceae bacterium]
MSNILDGLNDMQAEAVQYVNGPLLILAGAGSGKTRVLTHRIAYLISECGVNPYQILAVTFTNKAAGEMKERIGNIVGAGSENVWASTFHSTCVKILRRFIEKLGFDRDFIIYDRDDQKSLMKDIIKGMNLDPKKYKDKTFLNVISSAKDELIDPDMFIERAGGDHDYLLYGKAYNEYQKRLKANNALDFDDLIMKTVQLFRISPETLEYYRNRFRFILVDEYQDTNTAQFELIRLLAEHTNEYGDIEHNLCVVGDDDQSIYKFRGANIRNILDFEENYPDAKVIRLEQNYRSTKAILDTANEVIHNNRARKDKTLWTDNEQGTPVSFTCYPSDRDEAADIINTIYSEVREGNAEYKDFAILYRTNAQSRMFEERLVLRNIPYRIIGSINFYQRKEIKDMLAYLRVIASHSDDISVRRILNVPKRSIGATSIEKLSNYAEDNEQSLYDVLLRISEDPFLQKSLGVGRAVGGITKFVSLIEAYKNKLQNTSSLVDLLNELIEDIEYFEYLEDDDSDEKIEDRKENIGELVNKLAEYEAASENGDEPSSLSGFLEDVALVGDIDSYSENTDMVVLMTIHSAKGLEFDNVFLVGMEENVFPGSMSLNADDPEEEIAEERRLCYVGITRARKRLYLSAATTRMMHGNMAFNSISRFVKEIPRHLLTKKGDIGRTNTLSGNTSFKNFIERNRNVSKFSGYNNMETNKPKETSEHSRAYREKDAGYKKNNITLNDNPYASLPSKGINAIASTEGELGYTVGDKVKHIKFGVGTVKNIEKGSSDFEVTVDFPAGTKKMLASFAKLKKVE